MNLTISPDKKILTVDGEEYRFAEILMSKDAPVWKVKLVDGGVLMLWFNVGKGDKKIGTFSGGTAGRGFGEPYGSPGFAE